MIARLLRYLATIAVLSVIYFFAGKLGLRFASVNASATALWAPTGVALAALLVLGYRVWPGILLGAFLVNLNTAGGVATSLGIAAGNTLEALAGAYLVNRFAGGQNAFDRAQSVFSFAALAGIVSTMVSATIGVTVLSLGGLARWADYAAIWLTWWLGDGSGALVVAPLLILWMTRPRVRWNRGQICEAAVLLLATLVIGQGVFGGFSPPQFRNYPLQFLCIPLLTWAAFRLGQRAAATTVFLLSVIAIWNTLHSLGPFVEKTQNESLLVLQAFTGVIAVTFLALSAVVLERKEVEEALRRAHNDAELLVQQRTGELSRAVKALQLNIAQREQAERALRESEERFHAFMDHTPAVAFVKDDEGRYVFANKALEHFFQVAPGGLLGKTNADLKWMSPETANRTREMDRAVLEKGGAIERLDTIPTPDGVQRIWLIFKFPLNDASGQRFVGGVAVDMTARKQAEESLRTLSGRLLQLQDQERRRLARELHDSTGQKVTALGLNLHTIARVSPELGPKARETLSECLNLANEIAGELRTFSYLLHPPLLDEVGLISALKWFADGFTKRSGIRVDLDLPSDLGRQPRDVELAAFRVVQEALTNIHRHSKSATARIRMSQHANTLRLEIADQGEGIPPEVLNRIDESPVVLGVGIAGMRERMKQLGGRLEIQSGARGTLITVSLPLAESVSSAAQV